MLIWSVAVLALIASAGATASVWFRPIRTPSGEWELARISSQRAPGGQRFRLFTVGADWTVRFEFDLDGDGRWDLRGAYWQGRSPEECWRRVDDEAVSTSPEKCADAWQAILKSLDATDGGTAH